MREHKVMNCKDWEPDKFKPGSYCSIKVDGVRAFYYPGELNLWSRDNKKLWGFDHIIESLQGYEHAVDMELMLQGYDDWNKMAGIIRNHDMKPDALGVILDIPDAPGWFHQRWHRRPTGVYCLISPLQKCLYTEIEAEIEYEKALEQGHEGIVVKTPEHKYRNTRSYDWMRKVPVHSADCKCVGIYEGKGKMADMAGGIYIEFNGMTCKVGTMKGIDYEERRNMFWFQDEYIGRVAEVHYKELQQSGKPRQPRFKGWRHDK